MRMRVFMKKLRVKIENETRVYLESLNLESQSFTPADVKLGENCI